MQELATRIYLGKLIHIYNSLFRRYRDCLIGFPSADYS